MQKVVQVGVARASAGDVVILSPGCASFGLFLGRIRPRRQVPGSGSESDGGCTRVLPDELPAPPARVHFIGIGGIGMSGLAAVLHEQGYVITGSDSGSNAQTGQLSDSGVAIQLGHTDTTNAAAADLVVITAAVSDNPEIAAATERGIPNHQTRQAAAAGIAFGRGLRGVAPVRCVADRGYIIGP